MNANRTTPIRKAEPGDLPQLAAMRYALWPEASIEEHREELISILGGTVPGILPLVILVAGANGGALVGFIEVGLRSYADGCDPVHPVGYVEGWYVSTDHRRIGVGAELLGAAEEWARTQGCVEMASDTPLENDVSQCVHQALGFEVVSRSVNYCKRL